MKAVETSSGVFHLLVEDKEQIWIAHPGMNNRLRRTLREMEKSALFDIEKLHECGFSLEDESDVEDREIPVSDVITDDYMLGAEMGFMMGFLFHAGHTLEELTSEDFDVEGTYRELFNAMVPTEDEEEYDLTGEESDEELDDLVTSYYERNGFTKDTLPKLLERINNVSIRNRIRIRFGG